MSRNSNDSSTGEFIIVLAILAGLLTGVFIFFSQQPTRQPPGLDATVLEVVRWCEPNARESYTETTRSYNSKKSKWEDKTETRWRDAPDKFISCMREYGWQVAR